MAYSDDDNSVAIDANLNRFILDERSSSKIPEFLTSKLSSSYFFSKLSSKLNRGSYNIFCTKTFKNVETVICFLFFLSSEFLLYHCKFFVRPCIVYSYS